MGYQDGGDPGVEPDPEEIGLPGSILVRKPWLQPSSDPRTGFWEVCSGDVFWGSGEPASPPLGQAPYEPEPEPAGGDEEYEDQPRCRFRVGDRPISQMMTSWIDAAVVSDVSEYMDRFHENTVRALGDCVAPRWEEGKHLRIYFDGTGGKPFGPPREDGSREYTPPSWAIAIILQHTDSSLALVGILGGRVAAMGIFTEALEKIKDSSASAEMMAAIMAGLYAVQSEGARRGNLKVSIFGDNENARATAEGKNKASAMRMRAALLRNVSRWCCGVHPTCTWNYTKAHIGLPWNEMADVAADLAAEGLLPKPPAPDPAVSQQIVAEMDWKWLEDAPPGG